MPQLVLYNIPGRDCQSYSSGGATTGDAYLRWVSHVARAIGQYPAIVVLEPDAIDQAAEGCIPRDQVAPRYQLLSRAVRILKSDPRVYLYLDAGNSDWLPAARMIGPLRKSGIDRANGFALNVANFQTTRASIAYGRAISRRLGGRHFVINTSRNGNGPPVRSVDRWCNPAGRALGEPPTTNTGDGLVDAFLWVKYPGDSDGSCDRGNPPQERGGRPMRSRWQTPAIERQLADVHRARHRRRAVRVGHKQHVPARRDQALAGRHGERHCVVPAMQAQRD